jgi:hypothetical protein
MKAGSFSFSLVPETPQAIRNLIDFYGHIYIFDAQMRPGIGDAAMIAASRWAGVVRRRQTPWDVAGVNMIFWLGNEDGVGAILEALVGPGPNTFTAYVTSMLAQCPAVTAGTVVAGGANVTVSYQWITPRAMLDHLVSLYGYEYRVNKDGTLDAGTAASLFVTTPTAIVERLSSGRDLNVTGIHVTDLGIEIDAETYITRALVQDATNAWTGSTGTATPYKDLHGNLIKMTRATVSALTPNANAAALAASLVAAGEVLHQEIALTSDEYMIPRDVKAGDYINVYDPDSNLVDTTNPVRYRGEVLYPVKVRVVAVTWPIERGMGVWYRSVAGVWTDLTPYILWEDPGATLEIGASTRSLLTTPTS